MSVLSIDPSTPAPAAPPPPVVIVDHVVKHFPVGRKKDAAVVHAVDDVSFAIARGESLAIVGETGCGKSTIARMLVDLNKPDSGTITIDDEGSHRAVQIVFQNPWSALNRRKTIRHALEQPLIVHGIATSRADRDARVARLLEQVGLSEAYADRYPSALSGGELQRVTIARALAVSPKVIVLDEPTASLDASVTATVVNLLADLKRELGLSYVLITHELDVAAHLADRVAVMYLGQFVEVGSSEAVLGDPQHPYTRALLAAVPVADPRVPYTPVALRGEVPSAVMPPGGCRFHTRCPYVQESCAIQEPPLLLQPDIRHVACSRLDAVRASAAGVADDSAPDALGDGSGPAVDAELGEHVDQV